MQPAAPAFRRVAAVHPHWHGFLLLAADGNAVQHEGHASRGRYEMRDDALTVWWDAYPPDEFKRVGERFVHRSLAPEIPEFHHLRGIRLGGIDVPVTSVTVGIPGSPHEVALRLGTSDGNAYLQVVLWNEYECANLPDQAASVLDLGGNIGLAAVVFARRFPSARIFSVEPDPGNYAMLRANTLPFGDRTRHVQGAVWPQTGRLSLRTQDASGAPLGEWGIQVADRPDAAGPDAAGPDAAGPSVPCYDIPSLLNMAGFDEADILKVDIEGAELELFSDGVERWLRRVKLVIVETHDRFRPGSDSAVRAALRDGFDELPANGENLFFRRKPG